jgi:YD repeat-containing protein
MNKNVLLAVVLLLTGVTTLQAQPPTVPGVRPGIKSVTRKICGYGSAGDSTGMKFYSYRKYDSHGRLTTKGETQTVAMESSPGPALSWYYYAAKYIQPGVDSTRYVYTKDGKISDVKYRDRSGTRSRQSFTYDAQGNCIRQQDYSGTTAGEWKTFSYNNTGVLLKSTTGIGKTENMNVLFEYDSLGREISRITIRTTAAGVTRDSVSSIYSTRGKIIYKSGAVKTRTETVYTEYDSVKTVYIQYTFPGNQTSTYTMLYDYDSLTRKLIKETQHDNKRVHTVEYEYKDSRLSKRTTRTDSIITSVTVYNEYGDPERAESFNQSDGKPWSTELWLYNEKHDLVDYKLWGATGQLLQHELYSYTYY